VDCIKSLAKSVTKELKMKRNILLLLALLALNCSIAHGMDIYVSLEGSDSQSGQADQPLKSLAAAQQKARAFAGKEAVTIHVADGIYYLPETLVFDPQDSGTGQHPVTYKAVNEGGAILSGGSKLELTDVQRGRSTAGPDRENDIDKIRLWKSRK